MINDAVLNSDDKIIMIDGYTVHTSTVSDTDISSTAAILKPRALAEILVCTLIRETNLRDQSTVSC